jgi:hypothetical protein
MGSQKGELHYQRRLVGYYFATGFCKVSNLRVTQYVSDQRLGLKCMVDTTKDIWGDFGRPRIWTKSPSRLRATSFGGGNRQDLTLDWRANGAKDDVQATVRFVLDTGDDDRYDRPGYRKVPSLLSHFRRGSGPAVVGQMHLHFVIGRDPIDIAKKILRDGQWKWMKAGSKTTDYERWIAGKVKAEDIKTANCYQFVSYLLYKAGVPAKPQQKPFVVDPKSGKKYQRDILADAAAKGATPGSKAYDDATKKKELGLYLQDFAGNYRLAGSGYTPKRGDVVIYFVREGGVLQAKHVGMFTGKGREIVHNLGDGPGRYTPGVYYNSGVRWDDRAIYRYVGPALEDR